MNTDRRPRAHGAPSRCALDSLPRRRHEHSRQGLVAQRHRCIARPILNAEHHEPSTHAAFTRARTPLRDHVATSVRRYLGDLNGSDSSNLYEVALREFEIPLFDEVLQHCDGNLSKAAAMLGIDRGTLRKKLKSYGLV
jgi:Fis family transcriptional regulator